MPAPGFAMICASNMNRSMAAHFECQKLGLKGLTSYGTGTSVKLPGKRINKPNIYSFGTPYEEIYNDLKNKDENFYRSKGLLRILRRNIGVKLSPERFQESQLSADILVCFEDRVFDAVLLHLQGDSEGARPVHVINLSVTDNLEEAERYSKICAEFCKEIADYGDDWEVVVVEKIQKYEKILKQSLIHVVLFI